jgi:translation initiation factor IF-2
MSTKEILNRLSRSTNEVPRRKPVTAGPVTAAPQPETETRVSGGVIRRRRASDSAAAAETVETPRVTAPPTTTLRRRAASLPVAAEKADEVPAVETPVEVYDQTPIVPETTPAVEPELVPAEIAHALVDEGAGAKPPAEAPAPTPEATVQEAVEVVAVPAAPEETPAPVAEAAPEVSEIASVVPVGGAIPPAAPETMVSIGQALEAAALLAGSARPAEKAGRAHETAAKAPERAARATPVRPARTGRESAAEVRPTEKDAQAAAVASGHAAARAALRGGPGQEPGRALPTLGQRAQEANERGDGTRVTGLGKAVVRPPPGYDPNDPLGNRRRAREAAEASVRTPAKPAIPEPRWTEVGGAPEEAGKDDKDRPKGGRPRRRERKVGRVEMLVEDVPVEVRRKRRSRVAGQHQASPPPKAQKRRIQVDGRISVAALAQELSVKASEVIGRLLKLGTSATANEMLDSDTARIVASEFEYEVVDVGFDEQELLIRVSEEEVEDTLPRPPVVTIMGHVDHGKTTLLDKIRKSDVAGGEAGGITQHVGAYQVKQGDHLITFIDTPGHAAFTGMRARGAQVTDIVVLVVAADDGIMPQTVESINHTRAAGVPMIVAVNKCDKPGVKPEAVRRRLMDLGLQSEEYGGDTLMVNVSALTGKGIPELLDAILLQSEMLELHANPERHAEGIVLEARLERGRGPVATILIKEGTFRQGDYFVVGTKCGRVRAMADFDGKPLKEAGPSTPVEIMGVEEVPSAGDHLVVVESEKAARALADHRAGEAHLAGLKTRQKYTLEDLYSQTKPSEALRTLNLIVKCDVQGSVEAIVAALGDIHVVGAELKVLHSGVGAVSESDVMLAAAYGAVIIGFNVRPDSPARKAAEQANVEIRGYSIIYELLDEVRKAAVGMLAPITEEKFEGAAEVRNTFMIPKIGLVAGCLVQEGRVARSSDVRLVRDGKVVWEGRLGSLRRFKDDVREVQKGLECGIALEGYNDVKVGDRIEAFTRVKVAALG